MKKIFDIFYSTRLTAILFIIYSTAMGVATFIENDYGTQTAKALVYNAWWFEAIMVFFVINFFGNIFRYRLLKKEKWPVLLFHISFLLILIGAGITRYVGYEGLMLINEGETTNKFLSETTYINLVVDNNEVQKTYHKPTLFSAKGGNNWTFEQKFKKSEFSVELKEYLPWAKEQFFEDKNGEEYLFIVESSSGSRHEHYLKKGTLQNIHGVLVGFETKKIIKDEDRHPAFSDYDWIFKFKAESVESTEINGRKYQALYSKLWGSRPTSTTNCKMTQPGQNFSTSTGEIYVETWFDLKDSKLLKQVFTKYGCVPSRRLVSKETWVLIN